MATNTGNLVSGNGTVTLQGNGEMDANGFNVTNSANMTGIGSLSVNGNGGVGTLTLSGGNSYQGGTLVSNGTLGFTLSNSLGSGAVTITNSASLAYSGTGAQSFTNTISGNGSFVSAGTGTLTLAGNNSYTGGTLISTGVLGFTNANAFGTGAITDNATLLYSGAGTTTLATNISGTGGLTVASGALIITGSINNTGGSTLLTVNSGANVTLSGSNSLIVTNSPITPAIQVSSNAVLSIASANALSPYVTAYNPGGTNFSTNATRVTVLGVTGGQVFFTNSGVTTTIAGGTNIASRNNGVATNINVNENILVTGTGNGVTNMVISNGATLVQYAPAGNQGTSFTLQSNAIMQIGSGGTYVANLANLIGTSVVANSFTIDKGGTLQIASGGVYTNTSYAGNFNLGYSAGMNYLTNAGTLYLSNGLAMAGGTNEFDNTGTFTLAAGNGFRMSSGVDTVNLLGGSTTTVNGVNEGGTAGNGTNSITIYSNAVVTSTGLVGIGYTGGVSNVLTVQGGGTLNASGIGLSQVGSGVNSFLTNYGTISNSGGVTMNWQSGSNNNSTLMQMAGSFYNAGNSYLSGNNGNTTNSTALLDVVGGVFSNAGTLNMGYQGVSNVNTFQVDGGTAYASTINMGAGASGASGGTNQINLNGGTLSTKQFTLGASNAVAGEVNQINLNGGTLLAASGANTNFLASGVAAVAITGTGTINDGGQAITIGASIGGTGTLTKAGTGTLTLSGVNTFSGGSSLNAGGLNITSGSSLGSGNLSMSGGTTLGYTGSGSATLANNISLSSGNGTIANSSGSALTLSGNLTDSGSLLTLAGGTFKVVGTITGAYSLSNATANLSALNTNSAPASILGGSTLNLGGNNNPTTASALNFGATTDLSTQTNTLNLAGYNQSVASIANVGSGVSQVIDSIGGGTFSILGNSTFSGSIGGTQTTTAQRNLNLTIGSGANVNLTGKNTYTGNTTIQQRAVLDLGGGGQLTGTSNVVENSGTLLLGGNGRTNTVDTTANLNLNGGTLSMGGTNATTRTASQTFATLTLTGNSTINYIDFANLSGNSSLTFASIVMNGNTLNIFDWSGSNLYGDQSSSQVGFFTHLFDQSSLSASDLSNINFYAGNSISSQFLGTGAFSGHEIVPVPEPGVIVAAALLVGWLLFANRGMLIALINRRRA
jgi:autotransporter-associated beta strand protein